MNGCKRDEDLDICWAWPSGQKILQGGLDCPPYKDKLQLMTKEERIPADAQRRDVKHNFC